jgi:hypothetical protein
MHFHAQNGKILYGDCLAARRQSRAAIRTGMPARETVFPSRYDVQ